MSKHTPTPWRLKTSGNIGNAIEAYSGRKSSDYPDDGYRVVATYQECADSHDYQKNRDNCEANGAFIVRAVNSLASNEAKIDALEQELEALRKVGWCAQALLISDEIKHPTLSRADAVAEAYKRLRQQLGKWHMEFCDSKAALSSHTEQEGK